MNSSQILEQYSKEYKDIFFIDGANNLKFSHLKLKSYFEC